MAQKSEAKNMKIECTQNQKDILCQILADDENVCPFQDGTCYGYGWCYKCLDERIEWTITD